MESHGNTADKRANGRVPIARRSCDHCRSRKIACDRGSPCSNCINARLSCTHSTVASNATPTKQRVLVSAQYEQKIDDIANEISGIKLLLQDHGLNHNVKDSQPPTTTVVQPKSATSSGNLVENQTISSTYAGLPWDYSAHIPDIIRIVLEANKSNSEPQDSDLILSLQKLVNALEDPSVRHNSSIINTKSIQPQPQSGSAMPPLDAVVTVLRWAKVHEKLYQMTWLSQILPLQLFTDICRKIYFAVDEYTEIDFVIANGYLSYVFSEHVIVSGVADYQDHSRLCRQNLESALSRLPLLLPATLEVIAALTFGAFNAVENSKITIAWRFTSTAASLCQSLDYHSLRHRSRSDGTTRAAEEQLFWTVYAIEKGLSLRLGRSSTIRDSDITLPCNLTDVRVVKLGRVNGIIYDQLYSPASLNRPDEERSTVVQAIAAELRDLINQADREISEAQSQPDIDQVDPMRVVYIRCDLICLTSLLALILRSVANIQIVQADFQNDCVVISRKIMDMHQQCLEDIQRFKSNHNMVLKYINWAMIYCPVIPFSILFVRAIQLSDSNDLARLDRFANSFQVHNTPNEGITHPGRLYRLLCQAAHLHIRSNAHPQISDPSLNPIGMPFWNDFGLSQPMMGSEITENGDLSSGVLSSQGHYDWSLDTQQIMSLLDENIVL